MTDEFTSVQWDNEITQSNDNHINDNQHIEPDNDDSHNESTIDTQDDKIDTIKTSNNDIQQDEQDITNNTISKSPLQSRANSSLAASHDTASNANNHNGELHDDNNANDNADDDDDSNNLEGSGLITQTMILGAQSDEYNDATTSRNTNEELMPRSDSMNNVSTSTEELRKSTPAAETNATNQNITISSNSDNNINYEMKIKVVNPITEHEGSTSFTIYHIEIETNNPRLSKSKYTIVRRYSDFDILHQCLTFDHPTLLIPPLPNKQRLEYIKGGRFTDEFVSKRCNSLNIFLNRVIKHPILSRSEVLMIFLEDNDYWNSYKGSLHHLGDASNTMGHSNSSVEGVTDFLMNSFKKPHVESKFNKNFKEMDHQRLNLQDNLNKIDRIYTKVVNKQDSISKELNSFGDEFNKLTILLNNDFNGKHRVEEDLDENTKKIVGEFKNFSENLKKSGGYYNDLNKFIEFNYLNNLKDLEHYLIALGNLIKLKDYKILDYEMLDNYMDKAVNERDNLVNGGSLTSTTEGTISYLSRKFESLTGLRGGAAKLSYNRLEANGNPNEESEVANTSNLVNERIEKLNNRITLLEKEKAQAKIVYEQFEKDLINEWSQFQKIKDEEITESLNDLSDEYTKLYSNSYDDWNNMSIDIGKNLRLENKLGNDETRNEYFNHNAVIKNDDEIKDLLQGIDDI